LSTDDIVFDDVKYREPVRMRRPDRDRRWACVVYEVPAPGDMPIFLDRKPADAIERHALRDVSVELGGILLGRECIDDMTGEPFVWVTESLEAKHYENTQASFTYTHDSWEEITRERDKLYPDLDIVGWYHTHPDFGIFLSGHDLFIHRNFFDQPLQVAYVVDPVRQTRGFFRWKADGLDQVGGFTIVADRDDRLVLARLVNDLEGIANADTGGGGLSPRLEAELVAMLTRPPYQSAPAADRAQTAAMASFAGLLVGVIGFAAVLWINSLNQQVRDQADRIKVLGEAVQGNTDMQRMALHALSEKSEKGSTGGDLFTSAYKKSLAERDDYQAKSEKLAYINDRLAVEGKSLRAALDDTSQKLAKAEVEVKENAAEAKEARLLRDELKTANKQIASQNATIARKTELLEAVDETKASGIVRRAKWGTYLAIAGWAVALLLVAGLVTLWAYGHPVPPDDDRQSPVRPDEPAPHIIS
jgi:proteasome lid subunit RPN8/RPN11